MHAIATRRYVIDLADCDGWQPEIATADVGFCSLASAHDSKFDLLALGVAGWMRYVGGVDEQGNPIEISDPLLPVIQKAVQSSAEGKARVQSLLAIKAIFGDDLPEIACLLQK
ncbi:hypothetical protein ACULNC_11865 [Shigella flexneri]